MFQDLLMTVFLDGEIYNPKETANAKEELIEELV